MRNRIVRSRWTWILVLGLLVAAAPSFGARPGSKTASLQCVPGWRGSAGGSYGGVGFDVSCNNGRGVAQLPDVSGTAYSIRMGVESESGAVDCFFSGDSAVVNESCGSVRLQVR